MTIQTKMTPIEKQQIWRIKQIQIFYWKTTNLAYKTNTDFLWFW